MEKLKTIFKRVFTKDVILYFIFGILTTLINFITFYILANVFKLDENLSNLIAIIIAVLAAYITNKDLVFHSRATKITEKLKEFFKFIIGRLFTMIVEFVGGYILFKLPIPNIISKGIITVAVVILNFFVSKYFAFKTK